MEERKKKPNIKRPIRSPFDGGPVQHVPESSDCRQSDGFDLYRVSSALFWICGRLDIKNLYPAWLLPTCGTSAMPGCSNHHVISSVKAALINVIV